MTIQEGQTFSLQSLRNIYEPREALAIADLLMENITGLGKMNRIIDKSIPISETKRALLENYLGELLMHRPLQYVLGESWFCGLKFYVNENVLIPRPETEELVQWAALLTKDIRNNQGQSDIPVLALDIGTGSGCIAISLQKQVASLRAIACDISAQALEIAARNGRTHGVDIDWKELDFLDAVQREILESPDLILSNPPYIPEAEKKTMQPNVVDYEPHEALFVPDEDPLIFYRAIAAFAKQKQKPGGIVLVEMHEAQSANVMKLFSFENVFDIEIRQDMQGKERLLKATRMQ